MAVTWTQEEIDALKAAIASGVLTVTYAGPPQRSVTYHSLKEMRELLADMNRQEIEAPAYRRVKFDRGFER